MPVDLDFTARNWAILTASLGAAGGAVANLDVAFRELIGEVMQLRGRVTNLQAEIGQLTPKNDAAVVADAGRELAEREMPSLHPARPPYFKVAAE